MTILPGKLDDWNVYLQFPGTETLERAIARYVERIGEQPASWFEYRGAIYLGPAPERYLLRWPGQEAQA